MSKYNCQLNMCVTCGPVRITPNKADYLIYSTKAIIVQEHVDPESSSG